MSRINKPRTKKRTYAYEEYENRAGNRRLRSISSKRYEQGNYEDIIYSQKNPKEIKERQEAYEEGFMGIGDKTGSSDYLDTIEWGSMGGRPRKWANNRERMKFIRAQDKLNNGQSLSGEELTLITQYGSLGRPLTSAEKVRLHRFRKNKNN